MRISDWSSDVCSSDLFNLDGDSPGSGDGRPRRLRAEDLGRPRAASQQDLVGGKMLPVVQRHAPDRSILNPGLRSATDPERDRKRVGSGKSVSVRVNLGGSRIIKKKKKRKRKPK